MATLGKIKAKECVIGPSDTDSDNFVINATTGNVNFKINNPSGYHSTLAGNFTSTITTSIGLDIATGDKNSDAFQKVDGWLFEKLISRPVKGTFRDQSSTTNLSSAITNVATSVEVDNVSNFAAGNLLRIDSELVSVSSISNNTLTVVRGAKSTSNVAHLSGATVSFAGVLTTISSNINDSTITVQ